MVDAINSALDEERMTLLEFEGIVLSLPKNQILDIDTLSQFKRDRIEQNCSGSLSYNSRQIAVYTLNRDLTLVHQPTSQNHFCIAIRHSHENKIFALTCDAVHQFNKQAETIISAMPTLMQIPHSPLIGLMEKDNSLVLMSDAELLRNYIDSQEVAAHV